MSKLLGKEFGGRSSELIVRRTKIFNPNLIIFSFLALFAAAFQLAQSPLWQQNTSIAAIDPYSITSTRLLALVPNPPIQPVKTAPAIPPDKSVPVVVTQCDSIQYTNKFNAKNVFPILPPEILGENCSPPYWDLTIFKILLYKAFALLNYVILVTAIIMTIYAGLLYLSGFSNEKNIATAKTVLISTYVGLALSLSATLILRTTIGVFADDRNGNAIKTNEGEIFYGQ